VGIAMGDEGAAIKGGKYGLTGKFWVKLGDGGAVMEKM